MLFKIRENLETTIMEQTDDLRKNNRQLMQELAERRRVETALTRSEARFRSFMENGPALAFVKDEAGRYLYVNRAWEKLLGRSRREVEGKTDFEVWPQETAESLQANDRRAWESGQPLEMLETLTLPNGVTVYGLTVKFPLSDPAGGRWLGGMVIDITQMKQEEAARRETEVRYQSIFDNAGDPLIISDLEGKSLEVNRVACDLSGYTREELLQIPITRLIPPKFANRIPRMMKTIKKEGRAVFELEAVTRDGRSLPLEVSSRLIDFGGRMTILNILRDISERKETEAKLEAGFRKVASMLDDTIHAIGRIVELKDPYTAGHEERVAQLASALARELDLSEEAAGTIYMAGILHDIGKITVPAEILSKPTKLNAYEFSIIQTHAAAGYQILKDIDFPGPIALAILQHHERLDGSGYPNRLPAEKIIREARILTVADVVESMSSHRPYRPAIGLEKALEEITLNRGRLYDPEVVDACLRLFREKSFHFV